MPGAWSGGVYVDPERLVELIRRLGERGLVLPPVRGGGRHLVPTITGVVWLVFSLVSGLVSGGWVAVAEITVMTAIAIAVLGVSRRRQRNPNIVGSPRPMKDAALLWVTPGSDSDWPGALNCLGTAFGPSMPALRNHAGRIAHVSWPEQEDRSGGGIHFAFYPQFLTVARLMKEFDLALDEVIHVIHDRDVVSFASDGIHFSDEYTGENVELDGAERVELLKAIVRADHRSVTVRADALAVLCDDHAWSAALEVAKETRKDSALREAAGEVLQRIEAWAGGDASKGLLSLAQADEAGMGAVSLSEETGRSEEPTE